MRLTILVRGWDPVLDRARMGRDITFYWWRCWCYPEQRLLRDGDDFCDSCRLYLVWWRGIPVLPRNVMEPVGRIPCCRGVVIISVTGWGIKCLNMEILKETLSNDCTESSGYLQGSRCLRLAGTLCPLCLQWSWHRKTMIQLDCWLQKLPCVCSMFVLVVVVRIRSPKSSHLALLPLLTNNQNWTLCWEIIKTVS